MSNDNSFQIVCKNCGCLSIKIEEPHKAMREALVYCGDCGTSRGTVGALRDLSVQRYSDIVFSMPPTLPLIKGESASERQPAGQISKRYAELRRLRQHVEVAEWLARETERPLAGGRNRNKNATHPGSPLSNRAEAVRHSVQLDLKRTN
jgi:hypothetical protein